MNPNHFPHFSRSRFAPRTLVALLLGLFLLAGNVVLAQSSLPQTEIIIDCESNTSTSQITLSSGWSYTGVTDQVYGSASIHDGATGGTVGKTADFTPNLPVAGTYRIYAWWRAAGAYATNTYFRVKKNGAYIDERRFNQRQNGGQWVYIGTYNFSAGQNAGLRISNNGVTDGNVIVDAVRFSLVTPEVIVDNTDAGSVTTIGAWSAFSYDATINGTYLQTPGVAVTALPTASVAYTATLPVRGTYDVYLQWLNPNFNSSGNVPGIIEWEEGGVPRSAQFEIDQSGATAGEFESGFHWAKAGTFRFDSTGANPVTAKVTLFNNAGASTILTADAVRFRRVAATDVVIDNNDGAAAVEYTGTWVTADNPGLHRYAINHRHDNQGVSGAKTAKFKATLPKSGAYSVYLWWPINSANNGATAAPVTVAYAGGAMSTVYAPMRGAASGGKWWYAGTWNFTAGAGASVTISSSGTDGYIYADAVAFVQDSDSEWDGMQDDWEIQQFGNLTTATSTSDYDSDGLIDVEEFRAGLDPKTAHQFTKFAGDSQTGPANSVLSVPLQVKVSAGANGTSGAPVQLSITQGGGALSSDGVNWNSTVRLYTGVNGIAQVQWRLGKNGSTTNQVLAQFGNTQTLQFSAQSNDLVGRWRFEETSGTVAIDASGAGNNGVLGNVIYSSPSIEGSKAAQFDGNVHERNVALPNSDNRLLPGVNNQPFTIALWFKIKPNGTTEPNLYTLATNETYLTSGFRFGVDHELSFPTTYYPGDPKKPRLAFWATQSGGSLPRLLQQTSLKTDVWYHVAIVYTGTSGSMYINGQLAASANGTIVANTNSINIGGAIGGTRDFNGSIDDVRIYSKALSAAEVAGISNVDTDGDGVVDWWKLAYFPSIQADQINWSADPDGDGITNGVEHTNRTDPTDYYNGVIPTISLLGGANQTAGTGGILSNPVVFEVRRPDNSPWANAPLTITAPATGRIISAATGQRGAELKLTTDANGQISVFVKAQATANVIREIRGAGGYREAKTNVTTTNVIAVNEEWLMDEGVGSTAASSKSANAGTLLGGMGWQTGAKNSALRFVDGNDSTLVANATPARLNLGKDESFSIAAWIKMQPNSNSVGRIVSKGHFGWTTGYFLGTGHVGQGAVSFGVGNGVWQGGLLFGTQDRFDDGMWHHVIAIYDYETKRASIYVDGVKRKLVNTLGAGTVTVDDQLDFSAVSNLDASSTQALRFGGCLDQNNALIETFVGAVDEVRIYGGVLSPASITSIQTSYDSDSDGLTNYEEVNVYGTNPNNPHSDGNGVNNGDGMNDGDEVRLGRNPLTMPQQVSDSNGTTSFLRLHVFTPLE